MDEDGEEYEGKGKGRKKGRRSSIKLISPTSLKSPGESAFSPPPDTGAEGASVLPSPRGRRASSSLVATLEREAQIQATAQRLAATIPQPKPRYKIGSASRSLSKIARDARRAAQRSTSRGREASMPPELRMTRAEVQSKNPRKDSSTDNAQAGASDLGSISRQEVEGIAEQDFATGLDDSTGQLSDTKSETGHHDGDVQMIEDVSVIRADTATPTPESSQQEPVSVTGPVRPSHPPPVPPRPPGRNSHRRRYAIDPPSVHGALDPRPPRASQAAEPPLLDLHAPVPQQPSLHAAGRHRRSSAVDLDHERRSSDQQGAGREMSHGGGNDEERA